MCYHSKELSIAIWASSSTITSPATLHFSRISSVCSGDFYTSHQNSFAKGLFEEQQIARNSLQRILMFVYPIARSYVIIQLGSSTTHFLVLLLSILQFSRIPKSAVVISALQRICWKSKQLFQLCGLTWQ